MGIVILVIGLFLYLLPTVVASNNKKSNVGAIAVLNILLGWLLIPWVVALVWAVAKDKPQDIVKVFMDNHENEHHGYVRK